MPRPRSRRIYYYAVDPVVEIPKETVDFLRTEMKLQKVSTSMLRKEIGLTKGEMDRLFWLHNKDVNPHYSVKFSALKKINEFLGLKCVIEAKAYDEEYVFGER